MDLSNVLGGMILVALLGGVAISFVPRRQAVWARRAAIVVASAILLAAVRLWASFDAGRPGMQFELHKPWIPGLGTSIHLGVDGLSCRWCC